MATQLLSALVVCGAVGDLIGLGALVVTVRAGSV